MLHLAKHRLDAGEQFARGTALERFAHEGAARFQHGRRNIECGFEQDSRLQGMVIDQLLRNGEPGGLGLSRIGNSKW